MDALPVWAVFPATILVVVVAIEGGYRLGRGVHRRSGDEKESPVSAIAGTILALLAFIMAFTFGIVSDRYDARKTLVREEANAIRTAWSRSDFLPEPDRADAVRLLRDYVDRRLAAVQSRDLAQLTAALVESVRLQRRLWDMAVVNARKDMNSDVAALYIESLNELSNIHASRLNVGLQARMPAGMRRQAHGRRRISKVELDLDGPRRGILRNRGIEAAGPRGAGSTPTLRERTCWVLLAGGSNGARMSGGGE